MKNLQVSIARGLAIFLMVLYHSGAPSFCFFFLRLMLMPLFFFLSGYCFKPKYFSDAKTFLRSKLTKIYLPFVKWSIVFIILHNVFVRIGFYNSINAEMISVAYYYNMRMTLIAMLKSALLWQTAEPMLGTFWFLKSLFWGNVIFYLTCKLFGNYRLWGGLFLLVCSGIFSKFDLSIPPFDIDAIDVYASFFIMTGYLYHVYEIKIDRNIKFILLGFASVSIATFFIKTNMKYTPIELIIPYSVFAILGSLSVLGLSYHIEKKAGVRIKELIFFASDHSFQIMTWHILCFKVVSLPLIYLLGDEYTIICEHPIILSYAKLGFWILYLAAGFGIPLVWCYYSERLRSRIIN